MPTVFRVPHVVFDQLIAIDHESNEYQNFSMFAWEVLLDDSKPMDDEHFWPIIDDLNWDESTSDIEGISKRLAARLPLTEATRLFLAALNWTGELTWLTGLPEIDPPVEGEDSTEDFLYHLVGLGRAFVLSLSTDPAPAVEIANNVTYVESFKYVLQGCRKFYSLGEYVDAFVANGKFARSHSSPVINTMRKIDDNLPGLVLRANPRSYEVVTPIDSREIPYT